MDIALTLLGYQSNEIHKTYGSACIYKKKEKI